MELWWRLIGFVVLMGAGVAFVIWFAKHDARTVRVPFLCRHAHRFRLVRPGRFGWWIRRRWLEPAAVSNDPAFDAEWSADSRDHELMDALLRRREVRDALRSLGGLGCCVVALESKQLMAILTLPAGTTPSEAAHVEPARQALRTLHAAISEACRVRELPHRRPSLRLIVLFSLQMLAVGVLFGQFITRSTTAPSNPAITHLFWVLALVAIPLALLCAPLVMRFLKGHVGTMEDLVGPCGMAAVILWIGADVAALELNERLDRGPVRVLEAPVVKVPDTRSGRNGDFVDVIVQPPGADATRTVRVQRDVASELQPHTSWLIEETRPGWLGYEWRVSLRVQSRPVAK